MPIGYHFTSATLRDGSSVPPIGEKLVFEGEIEIGRSGLHWSKHPFDALTHAPGKWLHLVECSEPVEIGSDKYVSRERTILKTVDADGLCRRFAADRALSVAHLWDMPDVVREYLTTLDKTKMFAAWDAARGFAGRGARWAAAAAREAACNDSWNSAWHASLAACSMEAARADFQDRVDAAFTFHDTKGGSND